MTHASTLRAGDLLPHFTVTTIDGSLFPYASIWQRRNLLLVLLEKEPAPVDADVINAATTVARDFDAHDMMCVITRIGVDGLNAPAVIVADQWGEIIDVAPITGTGGERMATDLRQWLEYLVSRCPECEGEAR